MEDPATRRRVQRFETIREWNGHVKECDRRLGAGEEEMIARRQMFSATRDARVLKQAAITHPTHRTTGPSRSSFKNKGLATLGRQGKLSVANFCALQLFGCPQPLPGKIRSVSAT